MRPNKRSRNGALKASVATPRFLPFKRPTQAGGRYGLGLARPLPGPLSRGRFNRRAGPVYVSACILTQAAL